jgi:hypothetical protein
MWIDLLFIFLVVIGIMTLACHNNEYFFIKDTKYAHKLLDYDKYRQRKSKAQIQTTVRN